MKSITRYRILSLFVFVTASLFLSFGIYSSQVNAASTATATTTPVVACPAGFVCTPNPSSTTATALPTTTATVSAASSLKVTKDLSLGMTDAQVLILQRILNFDAATRIATTGPGSPGNETNYFGPATLRAVISLQIKRGVKPSVGYVGALTRAALDLQVINYAGSAGTAATINTTPFLSPTAAITSVSATSSVLTINTGPLVSVDFSLPLAGPVTTGSVSTSVSTSLAFSRDISVGISGDDVLTLQRYLNATVATRIATTGAGSPGSESNYFGNLTSVALKVFQQNNGLSPTGVVDAATRTVLNTKIQGVTTTSVAPTTTGTAASSSYVLYTAPNNGGSVYFLGTSNGVSNFRYKPNPVFISTYTGKDSFVLSLQQGVAAVKVSFVTVIVNISPAYGSGVQPAGVFTNTGGGGSNGGGGTGTSGDSNPVVPPAPVDTDAPNISGVSVNAVSYTQATIVWTTDEAASSQLGYGPDTNYGSLTSLDGSLTTSHSQTITGLTPGTTYYIDILSTDSSGNLAEVDAGSLMTTAYTVPDSPTALTATAVASTSVTLSWTAPAQTGGQAITDYLIQYKAAASSSYTTFAHAASTATSRMVTGLASSTVYAFQVSAVNSVGNSTPITVGVTTSGGITSVAPTVTVSAAGSISTTGATLNGAITADGGASSTLRGFNYGTTISYGSTISTGGTFGAASFSQAASGLTCNTTYHFRAFATNVSGTGVSGDTTFITGACITAPGAPTIGTVTPGNAQASVAFTPPGSTGGSAILYYTAVSGPGNITATSSGSPILVTNLVNGTSYTFKVTATNVIGTSTASASSTAVTPATVPGAPTMNSASAGNGRATVTYSAPASNGGSVITSYIITSSPGSISTTTPNATTTAVVTGLTNGQAYTFTVKAINAIGTGSASGVSSSVTPSSGATAPNAPTALTASGVTSSSVGLSWTAPASDGGSAITNYLVQYKLSASSTYSTFAHSASTATTTTVTGLASSSLYNFQVSAVNAIGTSTASTVLSTTTLSTGGGATTSDYALVTSYHTYSDPFPTGFASTTYVQDSSNVVYNIVGNHDLTSGDAVSYPITNVSSGTGDAPSVLTNGYDAVTLEFWMFGNSSLGNLGIMKGPGFDVEGNLGLNYTFFRTYNGVYAGTFTLKEPAITDKKWHYFAISYDKRFVRYYIDGKLYDMRYVDNTTTKIGPVFYNSISHVVTPTYTSLIANDTASYNSSGNPMANRRVTMAILTPSQIQQNYERGHGYTTIYASATGSGNGLSSTTPSSLASALSSLVPNTKLVLAPGTYNGTDFNVTADGTSTRDTILIQGQDGTGAAIIKGGTPILNGANYVTIRNVMFETATGTALTASSSSNVILDAVRVAGGGNGISVTNSPSFTMQSSIIDTTGVDLAFSNSSNSLVKNNTIVNGTTGVLYDSSSGSVTLVNNIVSGQSSISVDINDNASSYNYTADGNLYNPLSSVAVQVTTSAATDSYTPAQVISKQLSRAWHDYNVIGYSNAALANWSVDSDYDEETKGTAPEAKSTSFVPVFVNAAAGDYRLSTSTSVFNTPIDAGVPTVATGLHTGLAQTGDVEAAQTDQTGAIRSGTFDRYGYLSYVGNAPDIGAFEQAPPRSASFTLSGNANASAGVYTMASSTDSNYSELVRTLFSDVRLASGVTTVYWNGLDDLDRPLASSTYKIKLLTSNVVYTWDGVVGNSSTQISSLLGPFSGGPHQGENMMKSMVIATTTAIYTSGYNEGYLGLNTFDTSNPQLLTKNYGGGYPIYANDLATDGTALYTIDTDYTNGTGSDCKLQKYNMTTGSGTSTVSYTSFQGVDYTAASGNSSNGGGQVGYVLLHRGGGSISNCQHGDLSSDKYITVQSAGSENLVLVSLHDDNAVYRFDKTTGNTASAGASFTVPAPGDMFATGTDALWVVSSSTSVRYYTGLSNATPTLTNTISGFTNATAVAQYGSTLLVGDSGTDQVIAYTVDSSGSSTLLWKFGKSGGYSNGPSIPVVTDGVDNDFKFSNIAYIAFQPDGTFWVGDTEIRRSLHFDLSKNLLDTIAYGSVVYQTTANMSDPTQYFARFLQYKITYGNALNPTSTTTPSGWQYDKYWGNNSLPTQCNLGGLTSEVTLSDGKTYAQAGNCLVRLDPSTGLQYIRDYTAGKLKIYPDGSYYTFALATAGTSYGTLTPKKVVFTVPITSSSVITTTNAAGAVMIKQGNGTDTAGWFNSDPVNCYAGSGCAFPNQTPVLQGSHLIFNDAAGQNRNGYHLGAIPVGGSDWLWETQLAYGQLDGRGTFDEDYSDYGGNIVSANANDIVVGYHGEGFQSAGEAAQYMHYHDSGLFIGQFGINPIYGTANGPAISGNNFSNTLVPNGSTLYLYDGSEVGGRGPQRWSITGTSTENLLVSPQI